MFMYIQSHLERNNRSNQYQSAYKKFHWLISECHSTSPTDLFRSFCYYPTPGVSLSSVTSPSANQQPAIHNQFVIGHRQLCLDAHLSERGIQYTHCEPYLLQPEGIKECPLKILYLFLIILMYELSTIFTKYSIYQCIFSIDIFYLILRSVSANNMNRGILHSVRPPFWK